MRESSSAVFVWSTSSDLARKGICAIVFTVAGASCGISDAPGEPGVTAAASTVPPEQRLSACGQDPRVITGLASREICAGADLFFRETFEGNGRTCGTCHPASNNLTIDVPFIERLSAQQPNDPLFIAENPAFDLRPLETASLRSMAGILENVDDELGNFVDPVNKFVVRSVPHLLALSTSIKRDDDDVLTNELPTARTGWGGDGGSLLNFVNTAINQHFTKGLARDEGIDFRFATPLEMQLVETFQLALGRTNELNFAQLNLFDAQAQEGKLAYLDPMRGRCQVCHVNGGANFEDTGENRNFDTGTRIALSSTTIPTFDGVALFDGGFGGQGLAHPNVVAFPFDPPVNNGFGNNSFSPPPVIEAADTLPAFHTNAFGSSANNIEDVVTFYAGLFQQSAAGLALNERFGGPSNVGPDIENIGRFLRALNVALNLDMAKQRLRASQTILNRFQNLHPSIQRRLIELAVDELDDALVVLRDPRTPQPFYPIAVDRILLAKTEAAAALAAPTAGQRGGALSNAISRVENARDQIGSNIAFNLGAGSLFF